LKACEEGLDQRVDKSLPTTEVLEMIELVLNNNTFGFAGNHYKQVKGVAIGSMLGRNFACSYMRKWDERLLQQERKPHLYNRYIDDGFGIWGHGEDTLRQFAEHANSIHKDVQVELRWSRDRLEFLNTMVSVEDGHIYTTMYAKPSDKHLYLHAKSCHPTHTKKGMPYGLGVTIKRICQKKEDYETNMKTLKTQLRKRGYSGKTVDQQLNKVDQQDRQDLLRYKNKKSTNNRVPLVLTYNNLLPDVGQILHKHMKILHRSDRMQKVFEEPPVASHMRDVNLSDTLVHRKLNRVLKTPMHKCKKMCRVCPLMDSDTIACTDGKRSYRVIANQSCCTRNVVYALSCTQCGTCVYVGETERALKERVDEHLADIKHKRDKPVSLHFNSDGHSGNEIRVAAIQKIFDNSRYARKIKEDTQTENQSARRSEYEIATRH
jgi:hypothetical protein